MAEQNSPEHPPALDLERELTRKERQIEYLQTELRRYHNLMEELKQWMVPIGTIEKVKGDMAMVRLSGGQAFQVSIPPEIREKVSTDVDAVLPILLALGDHEKKLQSKTRVDHEMTSIEAKRLVDLSRRANWAYPTSFGRPVHWDRTEEWVESLDRERDSFVKAARYLMQTGEEDLALELAANVWRLWILAKDGEGGRKLLAEVLGSPGKRVRSRWRALAWYGDSLLAIKQGRLEESRKSSLAALKIAELTRDLEGLVLGNLAMSRVAMDDGDYDEARDRSSQARRYAHDLDPGFWQAPLFMQAQSYRMLGDYEKAASLFSESLDLNRRVEDKGMVIAELTNLGLVEIHRNNVERAERLLDEAEKLSGSKPDDPYGRAMTSLNKAMLAYRKNDIVQARSLLFTAKSTFAEAKIEPAIDDKSEINWLERELAKVNR